MPLLLPWKGEEKLLFCGHGRVIHLGTEVTGNLTIVILSCVLVADAKYAHLWNSLAVQWLRLGTFIAGVRIQSLVGELRSHKPRGSANK